MLMYTKELTLLALFSPLLGGVIAGIFGKWIGKRGAHVITITLMLVSFITSLILFKNILLSQAPKQVFELYSWAIAGSYHLNMVCWWIILQLR